MIRTSKETRLEAELKTVEDEISDILFRVNRGDFSPAQTVQQLEQLLNDVRKGRHQIAQI